MSLFGSSPDDSGLIKPDSRHQSKSLFDDGPKAAPEVNNSLFADYGGNESPWSIPTSKKAGRDELIRSLISPSDAPESYVNGFDAILENGGNMNSRLSLEDVMKLLQSSGIPQGDQTLILRLVSPATATGVDRNTFNLLMALIGLVQEGEEASLDGVDERKKSKAQACI